MERDKAYDLFKQLLHTARGLGMRLTFEHCCWAFRVMISSRSSFFCSMAFLSRVAYDNQHRERGGRREGEKKGDYNQASAQILYKYLVRTFLVAMPYPGDEAAAATY